VANLPNACEGYGQQTAEKSETKMKRHRQGKGREGGEREERGEAKPPLLLFVREIAIDDSRSTAAG